jgi:hypothetical protein
MVHLLYMVVDASMNPLPARASIAAKPLGHFLAFVRYDRVRRASRAVPDSSRRIQSGCAGAHDTSHRV